MSVNYCCIIAKKEKILLAESSTSQSSWTRIYQLLENLTKNKAKSGQVEIENEQTLTWVKGKEVMFMCRSPNRLGAEKPGRFMEGLINLVREEFGGLESVIDKNKAMNTNCLQRRVGAKFDQLIKDFDTGIYINKEVFNEINNELDGIKSTMNQNIKNMLKENDNLDELLIKSKKLENEAIVMEQEAKEMEKATRCLRPWMAYSLIFLLVCGIVYIVFALVKCGSLQIICEKQ